MAASPANAATKAAARATLTAAPGAAQSEAIEAAGADRQTRLSEVEEFVTLADECTNRVVGQVIAGDYSSFVPGANLRGCDLHGIDLTGMDLNGADLAFASLQDSVLSGADLSGANLTGANLGGAQIGGANFRGAILNYAAFSVPVPEQLRSETTILFSSDLEPIRYIAAMADGALIGATKSTVGRVDMRPDGSGLMVDAIQVSDNRMVQIKGLFPALTGSLVAVDTAANTADLKLIDMQGGQNHWVGNGEYYCDWSRDGTMIITGSSWKDKMSVWDAKSASLIFEAEEDGGARFSPDAQFIARDVYGRSEVMIHDRVSGEQVGTFPWCSIVGYSPDGRWLLCANKRQDTIYLRSVAPESGRPGESSTPLPGRASTHGVWSPDGSRLLLWADAQNLTDASSLAVYEVGLDLSLPVTIPLLRDPELWWWASDDHIGVLYLHKVTIPEIEVFDARTGESVGHQTLYGLRCWQPCLALPGASEVYLVVAGSNNLSNRMVKVPLGPLFTAR
jgi:WD40 repeat protein